MVCGGLPASLISSSLSESFIFLAIIVRASGTLVVPFLSIYPSASLIVSYPSASVGSWPINLPPVPSSFVEMVLAPSLSRRGKASLCSAFYPSFSVTFPSVDFSTLTVVAVDTLTLVIAAEDMPLTTAGPLASVVVAAARP